MRIYVKDAADVSKQAVDVDVDVSKQAVDVDVHETLLVTLMIESSAVKCFSFNALIFPLKSLTC